MGMKEAITSSEFGSICSGGKRKPYLPFNEFNEIDHEISSRSHLVQHRFHLKISSENY